MFSSFFNMLGSARHKYLDNDHILLEIEMVSVAIMAQAVRHFFAKPGKVLEV